MTSGRRKIIYAFVLAAALVAGAQFVSAQSATSTAVSQGGITYPIAELGNCTDKAACRSYCDKTENLDACIAFGRAHGLLNEDEAARGRKFSESLKGGTGPGGCASPEACRLYCSQVENFDECLAFAKKNGLETPKSDAAGKLSAYLKSGGTTPGNCADADSCKLYCADFTHADECRAFAEAAGLNTSQGANAVPPGQFQKFVELVKNGESPGKCATAEDCKSYCSDPSHREECVAFAKNAGLIDSTTPSVISGPGGCNSATSCQAYCNDQSHRDECLAFAKNRGLISTTTAQNIEDNIVKLRAGLSNAPTEVQNCLVSTLGRNTIDNIQSGALTPGTDIADSAKSCFQKFSADTKPSDIIAKAPTQVIACFKEKLGDKFEAVRSGATPLTPELADAMRACSTIASLRASSGLDGQALGASTTAQTLGAFLRNAPPTVGLCVKNKLGDRFSTALNIPNPSDDIKTIVRGCFEDFKPTDAQSQPKPSTVAPSSVRIEPTTGGFNTAPAPSTGTRPNFPPAVVACLKEHLPPDVFTKVMGGSRPDADSIEIVGKCFTSATGSSPAGNTSSPTLITPSGATSGGSDSGGFAPAPTTVNPLPPPSGATSGFGGGDYTAPSGDSSSGSSGFGGSGTETSPSSVPTFGSPSSSKSFSFANAWSAFLYFVLPHGN